MLEYHVIWGFMTHRCMIVDNKLFQWHFESVQDFLYKIAQTSDTDVVILWWQLPSSFVRIISLYW